MSRLVDTITTYLSEKRSFFLYIIIGFSGLTLDMLSFIFMVRFLQIHELVANPISMSVGIVNNFFVNAYFNFKRTDKLLVRLLSFYVVGLSGIVVSNLFLWLFNGILGGVIDSLLGFFWQKLVEYRLEMVKAASIVFIAIMQYFLNKRFSFKA